MFRKKKPVISQDRLKRVLGETPDDKERQRAPRESAWATCRLTWAGGSDSGVLLDISDTGARVRFNHRPSLPRIVELHVSVQSLSVKAEVVRTDGVDVGLRFLKD